MKPRYLTKSRFKLARECPTKLFYTGKGELYYDRNVDDDFLKALAEGGFQVGELAKKYYPGGIDIESLDYDEALAQTNELLAQEESIIYEAAFKYNDLFIRADIVIKKGTKLHLIEVKAKSIDAATETFSKKDSSGIVAKWKPYIEDIAFQKYVVQNAFPELQVSASLMLTDKSKKASVDGLNQNFLLYKKEDRSVCKYTGPSDINALGDKILTVIPVDVEIEIVYKNNDPIPFEDLVFSLAENYKNDNRITSPIGAQCGKCEFKLDLQDAILKSGFHECWKNAGAKDEQLAQPLVLDLWYFLKKDVYIKKGVYSLKDLTREDLEPKTKSKTPKVDPFLSRIDRQELQIKKCKDLDSSHFLNIEGLKNEMSNWKFPLHFIDFETTAVAIPFNAGRRPYEQIAFQFSHHVFHEDGTIEHSGQWISDEVGKFPNYNFVRALKRELENDEGSIFRYSNHENNILNTILNQLKDSDEADKEELCEWIRTITTSTSGSAEEWKGIRTMIDLLEMVKRYYYDPMMKGSNSIKAVLPAVLTSSEFLRTKYSKPIYGNEIKSKNFVNHILIKYDENGKPVSPYHLLSPIHPEASNEILDEFLLDEEAGIADGGAAMIAYARMQFTEMGIIERDRVTQALLRYCELDTLAMVMIYEAWNNWCK